MTRATFVSDILGRSSHSHHIHRNSWGAKPPHEVAADRGGSNCADVELSDKLDFHFAHLDVDVLAVTDHSRDGQQLKSRNHVAFEFFKQMRQNADWLKAELGVGPDQLDLAAATMLLPYCYDAATELIMYGDERILDNWARIEALRDRYPDQLLLSGVEVNLGTDGNIDTQLAYDPQCQVFILSLHPNYDPVAFLPFSSNPEVYQQALSEAVETHRPHIVAHPGYSCRLPNHQDGDTETAFRHQMAGWGDLGRACLEANTALEINFSRTWYKACKDWVDPKKHPIDDSGWRPVAEAAFEQTPLLNDPMLMWQLEEYVDRGGLFVINGDEHHIPRADAIPGRFMEIMELFGEWVDTRLANFGIQAEQVVNTWPRSQAEAFYVSRG